LLQRIYLATEMVSGKQNMLDGRRHAYSRVYSSPLLGSVKTQEVCALSHPVQRGLALSHRTLRARHRLQA
jgi:hypothetical protein